MVISAVLEFTNIEYLKKQRKSKMFAIVRNKTLVNSHLNTVHLTAKNLYDDKKKTKSLECDQV